MPLSSWEKLKTTLFHFKLSLQAGQFVKPQSKSMDLTSFLASNLQLLAFIILGFFLITACTTIWPKRTPVDSRLKRLKLALFMDHEKLRRAHLKLIFFFFTLFLFLNFNFLSGTIKTESVTVHTEEIVDSTAKLVAASKTLVFVRNYGLVEEAPEGSFLKQLSKKKFLELQSLKDLVRIEKNGIDQHVILTEETGLVYIMYVLAKQTKTTGLVAFQKSTSHHERLVGFPIRKNLEEEKKRFINSR